MSAAVVAKRYALAVFHLAEEHNQVEQTAASLQAVAQALQESAPLRHALKSPAYEAGVGITQALFQRVQAPTVLKNLPAVLGRKRRLGLLVPLAQAFAAIADEAAGRIQAVVCSASPLSQENQQQLQHQLERMLHKKVILQLKTDPQLLGGVIVTAGSRSWDGSLRSKLQSIQQQLNPS